MGGRTSSTWPTRPSWCSGPISSPASRDGLGLDPYVATPLVVMVLFLLGVAVQLVADQSAALAPDYEMHVQSALVLFGAALLIQTVLVIVFSADYQAVHTSYTDAVVAVGRLRLPAVKLVATGLAALDTRLALCVSQSHDHRQGDPRHLRRPADGAASRDQCQARRSRDLWARHRLRGDRRAGGRAQFLVLLRPRSLPWTVIGFAVAVIGGKGSVLGTLLAGLVVGAGRGAGLGDDLRELDLFRGLYAAASGLCVSADRLLRRARLMAVLASSRGVALGPRCRPRS